MDDANPSQPKGDGPLTCLSSNPRPPQLHSPAPHSPTASISQNECAAQTFHRFNDLPPELRNAIWELSLPHRVHTFPRPRPKFDFHNHIWTQEQSHGAQAEKRPAIAHVCSEARAVAFASGSAKKIAGPKKSSSWFRRVWVDRRRDTVVINMSQPGSHVYKRKSIDFLSGLLRNREVRVALDLSWALCFCVVYKDQAHELFRDFLHGHNECDFVIVDLQLDVTDEEAASTGLFGYSSTNTNVLVPIEDTCQMSRLFAAQAKFNTVDRLNKWANFTQFRKPTNLIDYMKRWEKLGGREMGSVQQGLDFLAGVEVGWQEKDVGELRAQAARAAAIRANIPTLRPVIMVSRLAEKSD